MSAALKTQNNQLPAIAADRGIDLAIWSALKNSIYPGARDESVAMAFDYCKARGLDPLLKPVHLVPMSVKDAQKDKYEWRDVVMPGIGLYRIQADRAGNYAGADEPVFGPTVAQEFKGGLKVSVPEFCVYTVHKIVGDRVVAYTAKEYWLENYATAGKETDAPNAMWRKRPFAQLAKCAEAQALRKAWPELGAQPTAEEMEGKDSFEVRDITPAKGAAAVSAIVRDEVHAEDAVIVDADPQQDHPAPEFNEDAEVSRAADEINACETLEALAALELPLGTKFQNHPEAMNTVISMWRSRKKTLREAAAKAYAAASGE